MFPQIFGKYVLEGEIAVGGMARVFLATLRGAGGVEKRLVVKQILTELASQEDFVARFVAEAKTAVELTHPNIVPVYELGVEAGVYYIAMEYCEGVTLADLLQVTGPLSPAEGAHVGAEILNALDYAHRRAGVVHRDVTPRNVLVDEEGAVRLIDFGIATPVNGERARVFGSPGHMPPEQLSGQALTPAADVFAVGALLVEAWTGRAPFRRASVAESEAALGAPLGPFENPALAPLSEHIRTSLSLAREARHASAEDMARPLRTFVRDCDPRDIARALGEKARRTRDAGISRSAASRSTAEALLPQSVPGGNVQTFATRRLPGASDAPPAPEQLSTTLSTDHAGAPGRALGLARRTPLVLAVSILAFGAALAMLSLGDRGSGSAVREGAGASDVAANEVARQGNAAPRPERTQAPDVRPLAGSAPELLAESASNVSASAERSAARAPRPPRQAPPEETGALTLTADPPSEVVVAGKAFTTPIVEKRFGPGRYEVMFRNEAWREPLRSTVEVMSGRRHRVHADFTHDPPRLVVR